MDITTTGNRRSLMTEITNLALYLAEKYGIIPKKDVK